MLAFSHSLELATTLAGFALGGRVAESTRTAALHSFATLLGADRDPGGDGGEGTLAAGVSAASRGDEATMPPEMERLAMEAVQKGPSIHCEGAVAADSPGERAACVLSDSGSSPDESYLLAQWPGAESHVCERLRRADPRIARWCLASSRDHFFSIPLCVLIAVPNHLSLPTPRRYPSRKSPSLPAGSRLVALLKMPFDDLRVAVYRFISAVALRTWGARMFLSTVALVERLCDAASESGVRACQWRFAAVAALARGGEGIPQSDALAAFLPAVLKARSNGPYGVPGSGGPAIPEAPLALPR